MPDENGSELIKKINQECLKKYQLGLELNNLFDDPWYLCDHFHELPFGYPNEYQTIWNNYASSLPSDFVDSDFSNQTFFCGPNGNFKLDNKNFIKCNFSNTFWISFHIDRTTYSNCNFSNSKFLDPSGIYNKNISCDFSGSTFSLFGFWGSNLYQDCNFTNATIHGLDFFYFDISKIEHWSSFTGSNMKSCRIIFDNKPPRGLIKKLSKSKLKEIMSLLFTPEQIAQMKIEYNRLW